MINDLCGVVTLDDSGALPPCGERVEYRLRFVGAKFGVCRDHLRPMVDHVIAEHGVVCVDKVVQ